MAADFTRTVLVAGGAGFIGSHLCRHLMAGGHRVICMDNFSTGRRERLEDLLSQPGFTLLEHDVTQPAPEDLPAPDAVFHLAASTSPSYYLNHPLAVAASIAQGAERLLELAVRSGAVFILGSSCEIYGRLVEDRPIREEDRGIADHLSPRACFDESMRYAEMLAMAYAKERRLRVVLARLFNVYGAGMPVEDGRALAVFITRALQGEALTMHAGGTARRAFTYVTDMAAQLALLMEKEAEGAFNMGSGKPVSIAELAGHILRLTGCEAGIEDIPAPPVPDYIPNTSRAAAVLGWSPQVGLEEGLEKTIASFRRALL